MSIEQRRSSASGQTGALGSASVNFGVLLVALFGLNALRNLATQFPHQLADETTFLLTAKFFPDADFVRSLGYAPYPGVLFLKIASAFADSSYYYTLIKLWNAACISLTAIPVYWIVKAVATTRVARIAAVLVTIAPPTAYGAYFTAESTFILAFWVFAACSFAALRQPANYFRAAIAGCLCGITYLIKPHAAGLAVGYALASIALLLVTRAWLVKALGPSDDTGNALRHDVRSARADGGWSFSVLTINVLAFAAAAGVTSIILGKVASGDWLAAFDFKIYSNLVDGDASRRLHAGTLAPVATLAVLNAASIVCALAVPLLLLGAFAARIRVQTPSSVVLAVLASSIIASLVAMTAKASADFHWIYGATNTLDRINGRYYMYAVPLLLFALLGSASAATRWAPRRVCTATVIIVIVSLCLMFVRDQFFSFIDAPDLAFLLTSGARITLAAIAVVLAVVLALRATDLTRVLLAAWASMSIVNIYVVWELQRNEETVHAGDRAVHALRGLFNRDELDRGIIVTNAHPYAAARVAFQLASRSPVVLTTSDALARTSQSTKWTLVLGDEGLEPLAGVSVRAGESTIYLHDDTLIPGELQTSKRLMFSFAAASRLRPIARPAHDPEPWGIWLTGSKSEIELPHALPKRGTLLITANLLEPRVQGPVTLTFCGTSFRLALTAALATHRLAYECEEPSNRIELSSMTPVSPRGLGLSNDARELSVALATIAAHGARADAQQEALARENAK